MKSAAIKDSFYNLNHGDSQNCNTLSISARFKPQSTSDRTQQNLKQRSPLLFTSAIAPA
ncbi:MAG: hypothetical protein KME42_28025 [Tildeniella nuda ZEHNDER 1965/U140]|jgi:hypothetical protein|nr:hypothetical protein [Tildeniella nuda ZEHNDER 1965/U140]